MSSAGKSSEANETEFQLGITSLDASTMLKQGKVSQGDRGTTSTDGPSSFRVPSAAEEHQMDESAKSSKGNREHVTDTIAKDYSTK